MFKNTKRSTVYCRDLPTYNTVTQGYCCIGHIEMLNSELWNHSIKVQTETLLKRKINSFIPQIIRSKHLSLTVIFDLLSWDHSTNSMWYKLLIQKLSNHANYLQKKCEII